MTGSKELMSCQRNCQNCHVEKEQKDIPRYMYLVARMPDSAWTIGHKVSGRWTLAHMILLVLLQIIV